MIMRSGVIAAGLVVAAVVLVAGGRAAPSRGGVTHTCSATDRQFISVAELNISSIGMFGEDYLHGNAQAKEVVFAARDASRQMGATDPRDGSLSSARRLMRAMFLEYGRAVRAHAAGKDAGKHMYRAYSLANFAHEVLVEAEPGLAKRGCDVKDLL
jgi:hypothetical protein